MLLTDINYERLVECITLYLSDRLVSEVVRKALQAQKVGGEAGTDSAEDCLHTNKQFTEIISLLPAMVRSLLLKM